jgi:membrane protease YdiL (CAAX protease family)
MTTADVVASATGAYDDPHWSIAALVVSCTITSIAFALVHADQLAHAWAPLAVLFTVSLVLCGVRLWTQSLAASTLIHSIYNGTIFTILFFGTGGFRHLDKIT